MERSIIKELRSVEQLLKDYLEIDRKPNEKYNMDSVTSMKTIETMKFHLLCFEISNSQIGLATTAIIEQTKTNVFDVSSSISSGKNIANRATITITIDRYVIWYGVKDFKKSTNLFLFFSTFSFSIFSSPC